MANIVKGEEMVLHTTITEDIAAAAAAREGNQAGVREVWLSDSGPVVT